jgi:plastocyanin
MSGSEWSKSRAESRHCRSKVVRLLAAVGLLSVIMATPAAAEVVSDVPLYVVSTGPASEFYGYTAPVVVTEKGGQVTYVNLDLARHNLVQDPQADGVAGSGKKPWCESYRKGKCPVFWTPQIGIGQQTEVLGLKSVKPGTTYTFFCTLHPGMRGTLVVRP